MAALGNPQDRFAPVVHVAGTNGKGSACAFVRAIAEAAGLRVHVYTSPHLVRFNERIRVGGTLISDEALIPLLEEVERVNAGQPVTFFEVTTAAAFLAFARNPADLVILEAGMGGRLDATNIVARPAVCAVMPVSFDHMQYLGDTLARIAGEKAGIIKPGVPVVLAPQPDEARAVLEAKAAEAGAPVFASGRDWRVEPLESGFRYHGRTTIDLPAPSLAGRHQVDNAGAALAIAEHLVAAGFDLRADHFCQGVARAEWPARLQRLTRGPLVDLLPPGTDLYLDGGHNEGGAAVLAEWAQGDGRPLDLVCAMLSTKDPVQFLARLAPRVRRLRAVTLPGEPLVLPAAAVADAARKAGMRDVATAAGYQAAVAELANAPGGPSRILICGSLGALCGAVLAENG